MANSWYDKGVEYYAASWSTDNIKAVLVDTSLYTKNLTTDQFLSAITLSARVATSGNFASKTLTAGVLDAADITFSAVSGAACALLVVYKDTGSAATSPLLFAIDTATNLPVTPNGGDISVAWDNGANKIAVL